MPQKKKDDKYLYIFMGVAFYIIVIMISLHTAAFMNRNPDENVFSAFISALDQFMESPLGFFPITLLSLEAIGVGTIVFAGIVLVLYCETEKDSKRMKSNESGSAKWYSDMNKYNKEFTDPPEKKENDGPLNMILGQDVFLSMNTRQTLRNNNILVIGGSGSGKSRFFCKPNILQANSSYVITDPSGELLTSQAAFLESKGYTIKVFNLVDMEHSNCYNPFEYIRDDLGVLMLVNCLIKNTTPPGSSKGDPFWEKSEQALLQALIFYLIKYRPKEERNFTSVMKLLRAAEVDENNPNAKSPLDRLFDEVQRTDPGSIALKQYQTFKMGAGKTLKSILISCSVRLTVFNMKEIENLTGTDNIDLGSLGDEKQALFVVIPAADDTYNFIVSMMYSQLFETLYYHAEIECPKGFYLQDKHKVNVKFAKDKETAENYIKEHPELTMVPGKKMLCSHVRFLLDEFANIGQIPEFDKKLATMRKYEISCSIILQNLAQIKEMYDKKAEGLIGNCDTILFLGSSEYETCEYISKKLGKGTVVVRNSSVNKGGKSSSGFSYNHSARELMTPDEVSRMDNSECIVFIRGLQAFKTKKYDYPKHPNYKYTGDAKDEQIYDYESKFNNGQSGLAKSLSAAISGSTSPENVNKATKTEESKEGIVTPTPNIAPSQQRPQASMPKYNIKKAQNNRSTNLKSNLGVENRDSRKQKKNESSDGSSAKEEWMF